MESVFLNPYLTSRCRKQLTHHMQYRTSKHPGINMHIISKISAVFIGLFALSSLAYGQRASTSSPYSRFGLGEIRGETLPQTRAMGGIASGVRYLSGYGNINVINPASYSALPLTTI